MVVARPTLRGRHFVMLWPRLGAMHPIRVIHGGVVMRFCTGFFTGIASIMLLGAAAKAPVSLNVGAEQIVSGEVNGAPVRLRVIASGPRTLFLNPSAVSRLGLSAGFFGGQARIGPVKKPVSSAVISYGVERQVWKHRVLWSDADFAPDADGGVGPGGVPQDVVTFRLNGPDGGRTYVLPMVEVESSYGALGLARAIGGAQVAILFDPMRDDNLATAAAGAALSSQLGGQLKGPARPEMIRLNVARPVRALTLDQPLQVGPLSLHDLMVRIGDFADGRAIADSDEADSSEIVVVGKKGRQRAVYNITLGRRALARCSSLVFDKPRKQIRLTCAD